MSRWLYSLHIYSYICPISIVNLTLAMRYRNTYSSPLGSSYYVLSLLVSLWKGGVGLLGLICLSLTLGAQSPIKIRGVVHSGKEPLPRVSITLLSVTDSTILSYAHTDAGGQFELTASGQLTQAIVSARCLGYKTYTQRLTLPTAHELDIDLKEDTYLLKEVSVQAPRVWGNQDTINYNVARLAKATDRSIGDVIRRIPGMRMEGGLLKYQGKPLKQINIEGIDLTQGDYGQITSNIDASDISTIQVLDNYQGIKALVGKRSSDDVILNLKLSPKKRGIWGVSLDLGLGYGDGLETNSRIRSNYLARRAQFLGVVYVDNSGRQYYESSFGVQRGGSREERIFARIDKPATPNLPPSYYTDNVSLMASGNSAFVLSDSSQLKLQGSYRYDKIRSEGSSQARYGRSSSPLLLDERIEHLLRQGSASTSLSYEKNLQSYYLKDQLRASASQSRASGIIALNGLATPQHQGLDALHLNNQMHFINGRTRLPIELILTQRLTTSDEDFETANNQQLQQVLPTLHSMIGQRGWFTSLYTDNRLRILNLPLVRYWTYSPQVFASYQWQSLSSSLLERTGSSYDRVLRVGVEQTLSYLRQKYSIDLALPVIYQLRRTSSDRLAGLLFEPHLKVKLALGQHWGLQLTGSYAHTEPRIRDWYPYPVLESYRSLTVGTPRLFREQIATIEGRVDYRDIFSFLSSSLRARQGMHYKPFIQMLLLGEDGGRYELLEHKHHTQTFSGVWSLSKGFTWAGLGIDLDLGYTHHLGQVAYQGTITPYKVHTQSVRLALKANPIKEILLDYNVYYGRNYTSRFASRTEIDNLLSETAQIGVAFGKNIFWDIILEHNHVSSSSEKTDVLLLDSQLKWIGSRVEVGCELNNLLGMQVYHSIQRLSYATIQHSYRLRPRAVLVKVSFKL